MAEEREWKYPVGTRRERTDGWYIKTHDNGPMDGIHSPWIKVPTIPEVFKKAFNDCDKTAREIFAAKEPIEGELWLDKEMDDFTTTSGKNFKASQFKKYVISRPGAYGYDFHSELTKRFIADTVAQNEKIAEVLESANEEKRFKLLNSGHPAEKMCLTDEEIKQIKEEIRRTVRADEKNKLVLKDVQEINECLTVVNNYLKKGVDFDTDEEKDTYKAAVDFKEKVLNGRSYTSIEEVKSSLKHHLLEINRVFKDNWGITASYEKQTVGKLDKYISNFLREIQKEEEDNFNEKYKINLVEPNSSKFYQEIRDKVFQGDIPTPEFMVGKIISSLDKYTTRYKDYEVVGVIRTNRDGDSPMKYSVLLKDVITGEEEEYTYVSRDFLQECYISKNFDNISVPLKVRFKKLYNKIIEGDWDINDTTTLETLENIHHYLPDGHLLTSNTIENFRKTSSLVDADNSYAHYEEHGRVIQLSNQALNNTERGVTDIHNGSQIASVLIHEIGHGVATKIGSRNSMQFRKFVKACGWSWEQFRGDSSRLWRTTGESREMKRFGTFKDTPILTDYAATSPNEAFAEYYSIYSQYKSEIDSLLKGDESRIKKVTKSKKENTQAKFSDFKKKVDAEHYSVDTIDSIFHQKKRDIKELIKTDVIDSFDETIHNLKQRDMNPYRVIQHKSPNLGSSSNAISPNPVFTIYDPFTRRHDVVKNKEVISGRNVTDKVRIDSEYHHYIDRSKHSDLNPGDKIFYEHNGEKFKGVIRQNRDHHKDTNLLPINKVQVKSFETEKTPEEGDIHYSNKYLRRDTPIYSITQEGYNILSAEGYTKEQIQSYVLDKVGEQNIPKVKYNDNGSEDTYKGLQYAGSIIPSSKIVKNSHVFKIMKEIWESDELAKALIELGFIEKAEDFDSLDVPEQIIDEIEKSKDSKGKEKIYGDCIVYDIDCPNKILLLLRNYQDEIMAGKWCLPGGHIDDGESSEQGAIRELKEESGLEPITYSKLGEIKANGCHITYMLVGVKSISGIILDNDEHYNYSWVDIKDLDEYEMIFDSKKNIQKLLSLKQNVVTNDLLKQLEEKFNKGEVEVEDYYEMKKSYKLVSC